ncbi:Alcohol dehydrogenase GroES-like domain [Popillia japonica]|uniref:Alcohol dehydrogenase GroES-like domain n=1 Tax=Popillia japonica TaxID=7064 RepID=A0AAW1MCE4_POPJA
MFKTPKILQLFIRNASTAKPLKKANKKMQAWQIHSYGDLSELQLTKARIPIIQNPKDVLIQVEAASLNPIDKMILGGYGRELLGFLRNYELEFPLTLGRDFAGVVIGKGHDVSNQIKVGDSVYGIIPPHKQGSFAETVLSSEETISKKPNNVTPVEAASIAYAAMTAWSALFLTGELLFRSAKHAVVLVLGASGGVGTAAVQILKAQGATVMATCSTDAVPLIQSLGADQVFDYRDKDCIENLAQAGFYDIILDCAKFGHQNIPNYWRYKRYITLNSPLLLNSDQYGFFGGLIVSAKDVLTSNIPKIIEGKTVRWGFVTPRKDGLNLITHLMHTQQIKPVIHKVYKFDEIPAAFDALSAGHLRGKIAIDFN